MMYAANVRRMGVAMFAPRTADPTAPHPGARRRPIRSRRSHPIRGRFRGRRRPPLRRRRDRARRLRRFPRLLERSRTASPEPDQADPGEDRQGQASGEPGGCACSAARAPPVRSRSVRPWRRPRAVRELRPFRCRRRLRCRRPGRRSELGNRGAISDANRRASRRHAAIAAVGRCPINAGDARRRLAQRADAKPSTVAYRLDGPGRRLRGRARGTREAQHRPGQGTMPCWAAPIRSPSRWSRATRRSTGPASPACKKMKPRRFAGN